MGMPSTPTRKRKRQIQVSYSEVQEVDANGMLRDVIVIEDTPPPTASATASLSMFNGVSAGSMDTYVPPRRTRAQVAAAAKAALSHMNNGAGSSSSSFIAPPAKKRKRENADDPGAYNGVYSKKPNLGIPSGKQWPGDGGAVTGVTSNQAPSCDDKEGHYIVTADDTIHNRYRTVRLLGQGTFGKVVEAIDTRLQTRVAVKIIRAIPKYRDASRIEIRVLNRLKERDPHNIHKCIHLLECFDHRNHICIVTELLGKCVYDFLKENDFVAFPRSHIQSFARQLLDSVAFLHSQSLVHTDLKPENILLVRNDYRLRTLPQPANGRRISAPKQRRELESTDIRLIDFGSATFDDEYHSTVVSTRHYRAPEIILGLGWSFPCDAFSLGCILVEFYTGVALFQTHDNLEHLAMMEAVMGKMPEKFARAGSRSKAEFFKEGAKLAWPNPKATRQSKKEVKSTKALQEIILSTDTLNRNFLDLVRKLLTFDPANRITVADALKHPYFSTKPPLD
ncbi:CMGC/CLK protein kinase [Gautieria morchelliformis]|nr:CMGC/CLK protein kinase [Gautieria morchelliformis]